jgi:hypothetical protein
MTFNDWLKLEAFIAANWQNAKLADKTAAELRHRVVMDLEYEAALTALVGMVRAGREFPPNPGQLYAEVTAKLRPAAPAAGTVIALLKVAAGTYGREREAEAIRWIASQSPHAARFVVEHGWRQYCLEGLEGPGDDGKDYSGAVRQRVERSIDACTAGLEREYREGRVLPLVSDHLARLDRGLAARTGLRHLTAGDVLGGRLARPELNEREEAA